MLGLSCLVIAASLGTSLLLALAYVLRLGATAPATAARAGRVLVLGMRLEADGAPTAVYRQRLDRALALLQAAPDALVFLLGGQTGAGPSEAEAGRAYLRARGLAAERTRIEDGSRHTLENLRHYRAHFPPCRERPVLITSRFHLARAVLMAQGLGLEVIPCAAEARWSATLSGLPRLLWEATLVHWYITGRSFSRCTGNRRMAARIS